MLYKTGKQGDTADTGYRFSVPVFSFSVPVHRFPTHVGKSNYSVVKDTLPKLHEVTVK